MQTRCIFCGVNVVLIHVHGHFQCPLCKTNALPCCDGDNCSNFLLADDEYLKNNEHDTAVGPAVNTEVKGSSS